MLNVEPLIFADDLRWSRVIALVMVPVLIQMLYQLCKSYMVLCFLFQFLEIFMFIFVAAL